MKHGHTLALQMLSSQKIRFGLVGAVNTLVDFGILFVLARLLGVPTLLANIISTTCAMSVSYLLNKKAVFGNADRHNPTQIVQFLAVTLTGLWVVQSVVIVAVTVLVHVLLPDVFVLLIAKLAATAASLVWNYIWYSRVVFKKETS